MTNERSFRESTVARALLAAGLATAALTCGSASARAATITVSGSCSLTQAITAVNNRTTVGSCPAGNGNDVIVIAAGSVINQASSLTIKRSVTIQSSVATTKADIEATSAVSGTLFGITPLTGTSVTVTFTDIRVRGTQLISGVRAIAPSANTSTLNLKRCDWGLFGQSAVSTTEFKVNVTDSYFHNNDAGQGGCIRMEGGGSNNALTIAGSTFDNNTASDAGGAVYDVSAGSATITSSTFSHNKSDIGGALELPSGVSTIRGSTIAYNTATLVGGGGSGSGTINISGTVIVSNDINGDVSQPSDWDFASTINTLNDSLLGSRLSFDSVGGSGNIPIVSVNANSKIGVANGLGEVLLDQIFDLGGVMIESPPTLRPNPSGPAVDALPSAPSGLTTDQRGFQRGVDVPGGTGTNRFDIGAFEYDPELQAESAFISGTSNGTLSQVTLAGFLPTLGGNTGKGIKFVPNGIGATIQFILPLVNGGGGTKLAFHIQSCPTCGTYRVDIKDFDPITPPAQFVSIGTSNFSSSTVKNVTTPALSLIPNVVRPGFTLEENDFLEIKFTLVSKPSNSSGEMVLDFVRFQ